MDKEKEQVSRPKAASFSIPELVGLARAGDIRVPNFQRNFVWDSGDVRDFFDSIWRGFPVGTLLFWRSRADAGTVSVGRVTVPVPERPDVYWVVDGQQRVTSMVGALTSQFRQADKRFNVYFDLRKGSFVTDSGRALPATYLPLNDALETRSLLAWLRDHAADLEPDDYDAADSLGAALREYQVPAYIVVSQDDRLLRKIFDRVNSAGKPIGRTEIFHALFASDTEPGSPKTVVESLAKRFHFGRIANGRVLQTLLALRGGNVQRDVHDEFTSGEEAVEWYEKSEEALAQAILFLRDQGIPHLLLVPSTLPLPVLAAFFYLHPEPEPWTRRLLSQWLWRGWAHGFGDQGQTPALRQAIYSVNPQRGKPSEAPTEDQAAMGLLSAVPSRPVRKLQLAPFRIGSSAAKLAILALASLGPLDPQGTPTDVGAECERHGIGAVTDMVPNRHGELGARGLWAVGEDLPRGNEPKAVLSSHLIPEEAARLLRADRIDEFVKLRGELIEQFVTRFVNARIEEHAIARPPLSRLIVPDEG